MKYVFVTLISAVLMACGGGGGLSATLGPIAKSTSYAGEKELLTYSDGSVVSNDATSSTVAWASDHITKTITYTFANGGTNTVVSTEPGNAGQPTYKAGEQFIVTKYGDGTTETAKNDATSSTVAWASDHITKTITYTFANGGTNTVVSKVSATSTTPTLTPAVYPSDWTTTGTITKPSVTSSVVTYGDGFSITQNGEKDKPFGQSVLSTQSISDPNAWVSSSTTLYDLRWGTPDKDGPGYAARFTPSSSSFTLDAPIKMWGGVVSGQCSMPPCTNGMTIGAPHEDVIQAWNAGWTGKGVNIMMEDFLNGEYLAHGVTTTLLANRYAPASTIYGYDVPYAYGFYNFNGTIAYPSAMVNIGVVNASFGPNLPILIGRNQSSNPWTSDELSNAATLYLEASNAIISRYTVVNPLHNFNYTDAVISKAAGNDSISASDEPLVKALANNSSINSRLLVVGALNKTGSIAAPQALAWYSNTAGSDVNVQSRFLVASGTTPFNTGDVALNDIAIGATITDQNGVNRNNVGTSYAAPRVAGYVAIVRSKFPNLDAIKTSSIMLDTARYDTLACYTAPGGCDSTIYGKGEVSLSRALAPVGRLR
jgi:hypothetical protein